MPLEVQQLEISPMSGLQQDIDKRILPTDGRWLRAENAVINARGVFTKRPGYTAAPATVLDPAGSLALPAWLDSTVAGELLATSGASDGLPHVYSYAPGASGWADKGDVCAASAVVVPVASPYVGAVHPQVAVADTLVRSYAWAVYDDDTSVTGSTVLVTRLEDMSTGAVLVDDRKIATQAPLTFAHFALGNYSATVWGPGPLHLHLIDTTSLVTTAILLPGIPATLDRFDAAPFLNDPARFVVAYVDALFPGTIQFEERDDTGAVLTSSAIATGGVVVSLSVCARSGVGKAVIFDAGNGVEGVVYPDPGGGTGVVFDAGASGVRVAGCIDGNGRITAAWNGVAGGVTGSTFAKACDTAGVLLGPLFSSVNATLLSRPYPYQGRVFALASVVRVGAAGNTVCLVCLDRPGDAPYLGTLEGILTRLGSLLGPLAAAITKQPYGAIVTSGDTNAECALELYNGAAVQTVSNGTVAAARLDFARTQPSFRGQPAEARGCLHHTGAYVGSYDGLSDAEVGFAAAPALNLRADVGGGAIAAGTYLYVACFEWTDRAGNLHRSEPCLPKSITLAGPNDAVDIDITTLCLTRRGNAENGEMRDVTVALFRTTNAGELYYRLTPPKASEVDAIVNDKTVNTVAYKDVLSDAGLVALGYGFVYTDGGTLGNSPVETAQAVCVHGGRMWLGGGTILWFSKLLVEGEAPGFNEGLTLSLADSPDGITALASLSDKLVVFTKSRIYYVSGQGPNDTGNAGSFAGPYLVTADTGCVDGRSIAIYPGGCIFQSANGLRVINAGLAVEDIGAPVQDETRGATVFRAVVDSARQRVKFLLDYGTSVNRYVVFDWHMNAWTTEVAYGRSGGDPPVPQATAARAFTLWLGKWVQVTSYGGTMIESSSTETGTDAGEFFPMTIETPWIHVGGVAGFQRVRRMTLVGQKLFSHKLNADLFVNYDETTVAQTAQWSAGFLAPIEGLPVERVQLHIAPQKSSALKVRISDTQDGVSTVSPDGYELAALQFELGVKPAGARLPATNKR